MESSALVAGVTGIVGNNLARHLRERGWLVYGLARRPRIDIAGMLPITADLLDPASLRSVLHAARPTHVFFSTWLRQKTEAENILVNSAMVRNLLDALSSTGSVRHVALVTGLKHYLGPFEAYGQSSLIATPFREDQPRLDVENFYYAQEDEVFAAAKRDGFTWSIHRPHTIIGYAVGNAMNLGTTLAAYATICRETRRPFLFPGSATQWNALTDVTDARLLARHLEWAATTDAARNLLSMLSTGTCLGGSGCGGVWQIGSDCRRRRFRAKGFRLSDSWATPARSGPTSPESIIWQNRISIGWRLRGTPMGTLAGQSRSSPI